MKSCSACCKKYKEPCPFDECRYWINWDEDHNCSLIAVDKNGPMTLREVGDRLGVSFVRIKQIEDKTKQKVWKRIVGDKTLLSVLPD